MNKAERTRRFIIEKSATIINKKGMAATSLSDIMEATKLTKGGIYGNFENKDEICKESFFYLTTSLANSLDRAVAQGRTAKEKLFNLIEAYKSIKTEDGGCPLLNFGTESDDTNDNIKEYVKKGIRSAQKRIFNIVSDGIEDGEVRADLNARNFSIKVFAMIEGAILCSKVLETNEQMNIITDSIKVDFESYLI